MHICLSDIQLYPSSPVGSRRLWPWQAVSIGPCLPQATLLDQNKQSKFGSKFIVDCGEPQ